MKCSLSGINARVIAKAIQSLAKFGSDMYVEANHSGLQLRTFNIAKSAMGTFRFSRTFFETLTAGDGEKECYCKIAMKTILPVFKNMKQVECCDIHLLMDESKLQVQFKCRMEVIKNVQISILDEENVSAAVSQDDAPNVITGSFKVFNDISNNFNSTDLEITLEAMGNGLTAKNYIEGARINEKFMKSQLKLSTSTLDVYNIKEESAVTFSLKEFRSFLLFAENIGEKLTLSFGEAGGPIFFTINKTDLIECSLVMTTIYPEDVSMYEEWKETEVNEGTLTSESCNMPPPQKRKHSNPQNNSAKYQASKKRLSEETTLSNTSTLFNFNTSNTTINSLDAPRNLTQQDIDMDDGHDDILLAATAVGESNVSQSKPTVLPERQSEILVTFQSTESNNFQPNGDDGVDSIPQSPSRGHTSKLRSIFARCFEATYVPREPSPSCPIFVANSDTED